MKQAKTHTDRYKTNKIKPKKIFVIEIKKLNAQLTKKLNKGLQLVLTSHSKVATLPFAT